MSRKTNSGRSSLIASRVSRPSAQSRTTCTSGNSGNSKRRYCRAGGSSSAMMALIFGSYGRGGNLGRTPRAPGYSHRNFEPARQRVEGELSRRAVELLEPLAGVGEPQSLANDPGWQTGSVVDDADLHRFPRPLRLDADPSRSGMGSDAVLDCVLYQRLQQKLRDRCFEHRGVDLVRDSGRSPNRIRMIERYRSSTSSSSLREISWSSDL